MKYNLQAAEYHATTLLGNFFTTLVTTVNSEIFTRVLFSRKFAYAKFRENNILISWRNHSVIYFFR